MNYEKYKVLVTGYGYVGRYLADYLVNQGADLTIIDRNLEHIAEMTVPNVKTIKGDVRYLEKELEFDYVFHTCGVTNVAYAENNPMKTYEDNVLATLNLLKHVKINKRFIFTSSAVVYGTSSCKSTGEDLPLNPISIYGLSKVAAENLVKHYCKQVKSDYTIFRFFNTYGIGQQKYYLIPQFITQALKESKIEMWNTTSQRDYIYIDDVIKGMVDMPLKENSKNEIINIGTGKSTLSGEVAEKIIKVIGKPIKFIDKKYYDRASSDILVANIEKAKNLGFNPKTKLEEGLTKMIEYYKKNGIYGARK